MLESASMSQLLLLCLVALASLLTGMALVLFWGVPKLERRVVFQPTRQVFKTPADFGVPFEQHLIRTPDGCELVGWHLRPPDPLASVIYFHGNSGNLGLHNEIFALFYKHGLHILAIDYRGYGKSTGSPTERGIYQDAMSAVDYFSERLSANGLPVIYWGRSLGGSVAAFAASRSKPHGVVLETTFPSKRSLMSDYPQYRPFLLFSRIRLNTLRHLRGHQFPVLVIHGDRDRTVPIDQGRLLFEGLSGPKEFFEVPGADHINIHRLNNASYMGRVLEFARQVRPPLVH